MKERPGWTWKEVGSGGYWTRNKGEAHSHRLEFFCPHCRRPTGTIDDKYLETIGVCSACYVAHLESRQNPDIDIEKYAKVDISGLDLSKPSFLEKLKEVKE